MIYLYSSSQPINLDLESRHYLQGRQMPTQYAFHWVYVLTVTSECDERELEILKTMFQAKRAKPEGYGFYLGCYPGQISPWGMKLTHVLSDLNLRTVALMDRYCFVVSEGPFDRLTERYLCRYFPDYWQRYDRLDGLKTQLRPAAIERLSVDDMDSLSAYKLLRRYGYYDGLVLELMRGQLAGRRLLPAALLAFRQSWHKPATQVFGAAVTTKQRKVVIDPKCYGYQVSAEQRILRCRFSSTDQEHIGYGMKASGYAFLASHGVSRIHQLHVWVRQNQRLEDSWSRYAHTSGLGVGLVHVLPADETPMVLTVGSAAETTPEHSHQGVLLLIGIAKMAHLALTCDHDVRLDDLRVAIPNYLNPEIFRRLQAVLLRATQLADEVVIHRIFNLTEQGVVPNLLDLFREQACGVHLDASLIPRHHPNLRMEDVLYRPWNDALLLWVAPSGMSLMKDVLERELCPYQVIGQLTEDDCLTIEADNQPLFSLSRQSLPSSEPYLPVCWRQRTAPAEATVDKPALLAWLSQPENQDTSLYWERLDVSGYGTTIQGMMVGPWATPVNRVVVREQGDGWQVETHRSASLSEEIDYQMWLFDALYAMGQHGVDAQSLALHLCAAHDEALAASARAFAKQCPLPVRLEYDLKTSQALMSITATMPRRAQVVSACMQNQADSQLYYVAPAQESWPVIKNWLQQMALLHDQAKILAYAALDQGIWPAVLRLCFASRQGLMIDERFDFSTGLSRLPGVIAQAAEGVLWPADWQVRPFATVVEQDSIQLTLSGQSCVFARAQLQKVWSKPWAMSIEKRARQQEEYFSYDTVLSASFLSLREQLLPTQRQWQAPEQAMRVAILRDRGTFGHFQIAKQLMALGATVEDVTINDLLIGQAELHSFAGLVLAGGATYGDEEGAGVGTAKKILHHPQLRQAFADFFVRHDTLTLGFGNGAQILQNIQCLIPGAHWPVAQENPCGHFVSRQVLVTVEASPSRVLQALQGARLPLSFGYRFGHLAAVSDDAQVALRIYHPHLQTVRSVLFNPAYADRGTLAMSNEDGRVTWFLCHPEYHMDAVKHACLPGVWSSDQGPWLRVFEDFLSELARLA